LQNGLFCETKANVLIIQIALFGRTPMRNTVVITAVCLLAGCSGPPPKPPQVQGEYRPVNRTPAPVPVSKKTSGARIFDFAFEGDIVDALYALRGVQPQLNVMPAIGTASPLSVRLNLRDATLEEVLSAIGAQGGKVAELVFSSSGHPGSDQAYIRFHASPQQSAQPLSLAPLAKPK
jgi:hypothetical protein